MKQSAAKTLGVAVVGAAFAAAAAGTAVAAPASVPDSVTGVLPVQDALTKLPAGAPESLAAGRTALANGTTTLPTTAQKSAKSAKKLLTADKADDPVAKLLGGLPLVGGLPTGGGLPTSGGLPGIG
ncbi:ATP-binding protein [Streptomyces sp. NPDC002730]|uniref:ATP-binding protein n=1 Tax=Streptomyces sp. NPDC002730 TaxID=3364662 RepID=UPI00369D09FC